MPGATSPLALPYPVAADAPAGHTQMQTLAESVQQALGSVAAGLQEGAIDAGSFEVTQASGGASMTLDVASNVGTGALVQDDGIARGALFYVPPTGSKSTVTLATAHATNPRVDRIVVSMAGVVSKVDGTATGGATLDNLTGAAAVPTDSLLLADALVPATDTTISNSQIRDRRKWARGAFNIIPRTAANYTTSSATRALIDATNLNPRIECSGSPIRTTLSGRLNHVTAGGGAAFAPWVDGAAIGTITDLFECDTVGGGDVFLNISYTFVPASAGSHRIGWAWRSVTADLITLLASTSVPLVMTVEELVCQNTANNATTTG